MIINAVIQGAGDVNFTTFNSMSGLLLRCICAYVMAYLTPIGYAGLWVSVPISWGYSLVLSAFRYRGRKWLTKAVVK